MILLVSLRQAFQARLSVYSFTSFGAFTDAIVDVPVFQKGVDRSRLIYIEFIPLKGDLDGNVKCNPP